MMESRVCKYMEKRHIISHFCRTVLSCGVVEKDVDVHTASEDVQATSVIELDIVAIFFLAVQNNFERLFGVKRVSALFDEIVSAAAWYDAKRDIVKVFNAVQNLVE